MATRQSVEAFLQQCEDAIRFAQEQYTEAAKQEHYNNDGYDEALRRLEDANNDLAQLALSANSQQREQINRMRLQIQQAQNNSDFI